MDFPPFAGEPSPHTPTSCCCSSPGDTPRSLQQFSCRATVTYLPPPPKNNLNLGPFPALSPGKAGPSSQAGSLKGLQPLCPGEVSPQDQLGVHTRNIQTYSACFPTQKSRNLVLLQDKWHYRTPYHANHVLHSCFPFLYLLPKDLTCHMQTCMTFYFLKKNTILYIYTYTQMHIGF